MSERGSSQRHIGVLGTVEPDADYNLTVDATIVAGLYDERRMERTRYFAGFVLSWEDFRAVKEVEGVESLRVNSPIHAAEH
jgi:hypothetical protein